MPTGYTAKIKDGVSFREYALSCARAFGALITMRDDSPDAPIPDEFKPSDHYAKEQARAQTELDGLLGMNLAGALVEARAEFDAEIRRREKHRQDNADLRAKYEAMRVQAQAWKPPTPDHEGLHAFMLSQIIKSIQFDCYEIEGSPALLSPEAWLTDKIAEARRRVAMYAEEQTKENERCRSRSEWVRALKASLVG